MIKENYSYLATEQFAFTNLDKNLIGDENSQENNFHSNIESIRRLTRKIQNKHYPTQNIDDIANIQNIFLQHFDSITAIISHERTIEHEYPSHYSVLLSTTIGSLVYDLEKIHDTLLQSPYKFESHLENIAALVRSLKSSLAEVQALVVLQSIETGLRDRYGSPQTIDIIDDLLQGKAEKITSSSSFNKLMRNAEKIFDLLENHKIYKKCLKNFYLNKRKIF